MNTFSADISNKFSLQALINSTKSGASLHLKSGTYYGNNIYIDRPITITGEGISTIIKMVGSKGYLFRIIKHKEVNEAGQNHHVVFRNLRLDGNARKSKVGAILISNLDQSTFKNIIIENFNGSAIDMSKAVRETIIENIHVRYSGNCKHPAINIRQSVEGEATNNIFMSNVFLDYSFGTDLYIGSDEDLNRAVRRIFINHLFIHGPLPAIQGRMYTWTNKELSKVRLYIGHAYDVKVISSSINVAGLNSPAIMIKSTKAGRLYGKKIGLASPFMVLLDGLSVSFRYHRIANQKTWDMEAGSAITILSGKNIIVTNNFFQGHSFFPVYVGPKANALILPTNITVNSEAKL